MQDLWSQRVVKKISFGWQMHFSVRFTPLVDLIIAQNWAKEISLSTLRLAPFPRHLQCSKVARNESLFPCHFIILSSAQRTSNNDPKVHGTNSIVSVKLWVQWAWVHYILSVDQYQQKVPKEEELYFELGTYLNQGIFRRTCCLSSHLRRAENRLISESGECGVSRQECLPWLRYF